MVNGIGDTICVTPAIEALRQKYPDAELTVIIRPRIVPLVSGNPNIDDVIVYDTGNGVRKRLEFFVALIQKRIDLWVDLHVPTFNTTSSNRRDYFRNSIMMRIARPVYRVGYAAPGLALSDSPISAALGFSHQKRKHRYHHAGSCQSGPESEILKTCHHR